MNGGGRSDWALNNAKKIAGQVEVDWATGRDVFKIRLAPGMDQEALDNGNNMLKMAEPEYLTRYLEKLGVTPTPKMIELLRSQQGAIRVNEDVKHTCTGGKTQYSSAIEVRPPLQARMVVKALKHEKDLRQQVSTAALKKISEVPNEDRLLHNVRVRRQLGQITRAAFEPGADQGLEEHRKGFLEFAQDLMFPFSIIAKDQEAARKHLVAQKQKRSAAAGKKGAKGAKALAETSRELGATGGPGRAADARTPRRSAAVGFRASSHVSPTREDAEAASPDGARSRRRSRAVSRAAPGTARSRRPSMARGSVAESMASSVVEGSDDEEPETPPESPTAAKLRAALASGRTEVEELEDGHIRFVDAAAMHNFMSELGAEEQAEFMRRRRVSIGPLASRGGASSPSSSSQPRLARNALNVEQMRGAHERQRKTKVLAGSLVGWDDRQPVLMSLARMSSLRHVNPHVVREDPLRSHVEEEGHAGLPAELSAIGEERSGQLKELSSASVVPPRFPREQHPAPRPTSAHSLRRGPTGAVQPHRDPAAQNQHVHQHRVSAHRCYGRRDAETLQRGTALLQRVRERAESGDGEDGAEGGHLWSSKLRKSFMSQGFSQSIRAGPSVLRDPVITFYLEQCHRLQGTEPGDTSLPRHKRPFVDPNLRSELTRGLGSRTSFADVQDLQAKFADSLVTWYQHDCPRPTKESVSQASLGLAVEALTSLSTTHFLRKMLNYLYARFVVGVVHSEDGAGAEGSRDDGSDDAEVFPAAKNLPEGCSVEEQDQRLQDMAQAWTAMLRRYKDDPGLSKLAVGFLLPAWLLCVRSSVQETFEKALPLWASTEVGKLTLRAMDKAVLDILDHRGLYSQMSCMSSHPSSIAILRSFQRRTHQPVHKSLGDTSSLVRKALMTSLAAEGRRLAQQSTAKPAEPEPEDDLLAQLMHDAAHKAMPRESDRGGEGTAHEAEVKPRRKKKPANEEEREQAIAGPAPQIEGVETRLALAAHMRGQVVPGGGANRSTSLPPGLQGAGHDADSRKGGRGDWLYRKG
ncbi:unnamed protein product [Pedinophyceae sp. YPF-701]|nr:unnamed protein product [Pedinophyceae sp. YPF-701]